MDKPKRGRGRLAGDGRGNLGGGPKTAEGLARCAEASGRAHTRHGLYAMVRGGPFPGCDLCLLAADCVDFQEGRECVQAALTMTEVLEDLAKRPGIAETAGHLVNIYARRVVMLAVIERHLAADGAFKLVDGVIKASDLLDLRERVEGALWRAANDLGLTPGARSRMKLLSAGDDAQQKLFELIGEAEKIRKEEWVKGQQGTMEGEWEEVTAGDV